ncbi:ADP-ribosylglycohydrolase family protein [Candidatus Enterococcus clewellii]|uniref:ADP-ribosylglycohydrolase n=1 Tax=Candidatus Enterococcus clewellii TaxID=1834193 RepID=A0A242KDZ3_9ENTE|nr:ADP-ribosylglycohydrolase family protein [Enterococcus sp. 9E7_DIV0242]OTP19008.1 hypothetical protein A5888_000822 [Enterococcus sp. 9E7_DIV0242]
MENELIRVADDSKKMDLNRKNQIESVLYGFIVGDCLGVPVEFKKRGTFLVNEMIGYGTYNQPPGTWSDDTSLTFCLIENLVESGNISTLMDKFVRYRDEGYLTPFNEMFDIGITTVEAIERFKKGVPAEKCGGTGERENGNGALMRISPLVFILQKEESFQRRVEVVKSYSEITHAHPRSIVGSLIYIELLRNMSAGHSLKQSLPLVEQCFSEYLSETDDYIKELVHYSRIFQENFFEIPENQIRSSGYVIDSLEAAIWCLGTTSSYKEAVLVAVNLGEDTDTIGAITGSLAGLYYTYQAIPKEWLEVIANKEILDTRIQQLVKLCV